jgi:hypothetical protein
VERLTPTERQRCSTPGQRAGRSGEHGTDILFRHGYFVRILPTQEVVANIDHGHALQRKAKPLGNLWLIPAGR